MLSFEAHRPARRPNLTPMIDVVFLLLVFFMLASRFISESTVPLANAAGQGGQDPAPLRLVDIGREGLELNGSPVSIEGLPAALAAIDSTPDAPVVLRGREAALQGLVSVVESLRAAGFTRLVLVE
ncbi:hypothetical protein BMG00_12860 [Thioclava marina]|uniref:Biopolymer transporter ExbD n=1 Tax=Thioclava marina TaxID=1915077 RepID=A0ABX3MPF2_9RHOB|nr:biopolymer transporter ExbD [Thioclava marina]OOY11958.1 hypothetical protein BMG00_12860 [Thioclava marina]